MLYRNIGSYKLNNEKIQMSQHDKIKQSATVTSLKADWNIKTYIQHNNTFNQLVHNKAPRYPKRT